MEDVFFELIQVTLGNRECLSRTPNEQKWTKLYALCQKQAISGIVFYALDRLNTYGQKPPLTVLYEWIGFAQAIETRNLLVNKLCVEICQKLSNDGFKTCILKGQGNAMLYPKPLLRIPGDIDLYVSQKSRKTRKDIIRYVKNKNPKGCVLYHHIELGEYKGCEVEIHYRPSFMFNPIYNRRLQKWFKKMADGGWQMVELSENAGFIKIPNEEFNIIFQLSHIYNHLLHEGIGLRQIIDYYYLLMNAKDNARWKKEDLREILKFLGLEKIAGAMMWVLYEKLRMKEDYLIASIDEKRGRVILTEIMKGGNFGHYDEENQRANSAIKKNIQRIRRDLRMMRYFPSECFWEPVFRIYHYFWRMAN